MKQILLIALMVCTGTLSWASPQNKFFEIQNQEVQSPSEVELRIEEFLNSPRIQEWLGIDEPVTFKILGTNEDGETLVQFNQLKMAISHADEELTVRFVDHPQSLKMQLSVNKMAWVIPTSIEAEFTFKDRAHRLQSRYQKFYAPFSSDEISTWISGVFSEVNAQSNTPLAGFCDIGCITIVAALFYFALLIFAPWLLVLIWLIQT